MDWSDWQAFADASQYPLVGVSATGVLSNGVTIHSTGPYDAYLVLREVKKSLERPAPTYTAYPTANTGRMPS